MAGVTSRNVFLALQIGVTLFAVAGGLVFYVLLVSIAHVNTLFAFVLGFVFALLARQAVSSLVLEWLLARARGSALDDGMDDGMDDGASGQSESPPPRQ
jgi:hypothetical protein